MVVTLIHRTIKLPLILREYSLNIVEWWVDGSFGVHPYIRGNTVVIWCP